MRAFFIIWRDEAGRRWWPVGKLIDLGSMFAFVYTAGARQSENFRPFAKMPQLESIYLANELFPIIKNRVLSKNRPDYAKYASWSGKEADNIDPLALMGTMGGERATDMLQVYPVPMRNPYGFYEATFFCHGISHLPQAAQEKVLTLAEDELLYPMLDMQNPYDAEAVALRTDDPTSLVGYCPRHLCFDIKDLMEAHHEYVSLHVLRVNSDAPPQFKLLIQAKAKWPDGFTPCDRDVYKPLLDYEAILSRFLSSDIAALKAS